MNGRLLVAAAIVLALAGAATWFYLGSSSRGPGVATENPCEVFPSLNGALAGWMHAERSVHPGLTCEHFAEISDTTTKAAAPAPWTAGNGVLERAPQRWRSPDGRLLLLPSAERLTVVDLTEGTEIVLVEGGRTRSWADAGWIDARSFVAAGLATDGGKQAPTLSVYRLDDGRLSVYQGPSSRSR